MLFSDFKLSANNYLNKLTMWINNESLMIWTQVLYFSWILGLFTMTRTKKSTFFSLYDPNTSRFKLTVLKRNPWCSDTEKKHWGKPRVKALSATRVSQEVPKQTCVLSFCLCQSSWCKGKPSLEGSHGILASQVLCNQLLDLLEQQVVLCENMWLIIMLCWSFF